MTSVGLRIPLRGVQLVEASAGSGKTYTIATLFVRALLERDVTVDRVLVLTFTRAATAELQERLRARLVQARDAWRDATAPQDGDLNALWTQRSEHRAQDLHRLQLAVTEFDRASVFTIHGYCQRILQSHAFASGAPFSLELLQSDRDLVRDAVHDFWARHLYESPRWIWSTGAIKLTPDDLVKLAEAVHGHRDARLCPEPHREADGTISVTPPSNARFVQAKQRFTDAWREHGHDTLETLATTKVLKHNKYRADVVRGRWPTQIAGYLASEEITPPESMLRMTPQAMADQLAKGHSVPPTLPIARPLDDLIAASTELSSELTAWQLRLRWVLIEEVEATVTRRKAERSQLTFDDLLHQLRGALRGRGGDELAQQLRAAFPIALVDEFQDTDPVQSAVFLKIYADRPGDHALLMIGDPKQAIYGFRGADIFAYLDAAKRASDPAHALAHNWRSDPGLVSAVNAVFSCDHPPFKYPQIRFSPAEAAPSARTRLTGEPRDTTPLTFLMLPTDDPHKAMGVTRAREVAIEQTARHIGHLLQSGVQIHGKGEETLRDVLPRDIAVLCRKHEQAADLQQALRELGIPTARDGNSSVFDAVVALSLQRVLHALVEPTDRAALRLALVTPIFGLSAQELMALEDPLHPEAWEAWVSRVHGWHDLWNRRGFIEMFQELMRDADVSARLLSAPDGQRHLTDLNHLAELLQRQRQDHHAGPQALVQWLARMRADKDARESSDETQMRLETDEHAVRITTLHSSKGLEYPIVYCPFLWDATFKAQHATIVFHEPQTAAGLHIDMDVPHAEAHVAIAADEALAEDLRLAYVALTRARHRCIVAWGAITSRAPNALGYLLGPRGADIHAQVQALIDACPTYIDRQIANLPPPATYARPSATTVAIAARTRKRVHLPGLRLSSYSRLIQRHAALSIEATEGQDRDEAATTFTPQPAREHSPAPTVRLANRKGSASVGLVVHTALEHNDFRPDGRAQLSAYLIDSAASHGVSIDEARDWSAALSDCLDTRLGSNELDFALADLQPQDRLSEMEFIFPVTPSLSARRLADCIDDHGHGFGGGAYAARLRDLSFSAFSGFLRGYIDLCFQHNGRYYVLDFKTNHLGNLVSSYGPEEMHESMVAKDYYLQALIYSVALHRHLQSRLPAYDYDAHFGGYLYLFLRGMAPAHPPGHGVVFDRPASALLDDVADRLAARSR